MLGNAAQNTTQPLVDNRSRELTHSAAVFWPTPPGTKCQGHSFPRLAMSSMAMTRNRLIEYTYYI